MRTLGEGVATSLVVQGVDSGGTSEVDSGGTSEVESGGTSDVDEGGGGGLFKNKSANARRRSNIGLTLQSTPKAGASQKSREPPGEGWEHRSWCKESTPVGHQKLIPEEHQK